MTPLASKVAPLTHGSSNQDMVFQKICTFLAPFNRSGVELTRATEITKDMEVDSVAVFDLIMEVEDEYEIAFPMEMIAEMKTIGDLIDTIQSLTA